MCLLELATKIEIEGDFKNPDTHTLDALWEVVKNAFIHALVPAIDNQINLKSVDTSSEKPDNFLKKIFGSKKDKSSEKDKKKDK